MSSSNQRKPGPAQANIDRIAELEKQFLEQRTLVDKIGDAIGTFAGSMPFFLLHVAWFAIWALINTNRIPGIPAFDPYPFLFLSMVVSMEAVLLSTFVLMKQNRMSKRSDRRNELNLQIDLLSEREATKMLQMLKAMCDHMGLGQVAGDEEVRELSEVTKVESIAHQLEEKLPD